MPEGIAGQPSTARLEVDCEVGIIGAGFGGIIAALGLRQAGRDSFVIFERSIDVGGVWRDNVYPGCACDVKSDLYCLASDPNPDWSTSYASQPEILEYLRGVVRRHDLVPRIRFGTNITEVRYLEPHCCWRITSDQGNTWHVKALILGTGPQNRPFKPAIPGEESFRGTVIHSAKWDSSVDFRDKRVAIIGTGASAIQIVPSIAPLVSRLVVFQRSAPWILPRLNRRISQAEKTLFRLFPPAQAMVRSILYWTLEFIGLAFLGNRNISAFLTWIALRKLRHEVADPQIRAKLTPDYELGCKRVLVSDDFYPAFNRENVLLETDSIRRITPSGLETADGRLHDVDAIIFATGFVVADTDGYLPVVGANGLLLADAWNRSGYEAFLGIHVAGFPNLSLLLGPNSGLGHSSALHVMESQVRYITQYLSALDSVSALDVKAAVQQTYSADVQERLTGTVWSSGCRSWYINRSGRNTTIYPGLTHTYRRATARLDLTNYVSLRTGS